MSIHSYKRDTRAHITSLQSKATEETLRADKAERDVRQMAIELARWKDRALVAEAAAKSGGNSS